MLQSTSTTIDPTNVRSVAKSALVYIVIRSVANPPSACISRHSPINKIAIMRVPGIVLSAMVIDVKKI